MANAQIDAYLNEFKGNLFEYLFAHEIALAFGLQDNFILSLGREFRHKLQQYEVFIREHKPELLLNLKNYSHQAVSKLTSLLSDDVQDIQLVGKIANSNNKNQYDEADIIIKLKSGELELISLKLAKHQSHINTKSAGVRTILTKYFADFNSHEDQKKFDEVVNHAYSEMAYALHEIKGLTCDLKFNEWQANGYSILPGELSDDCRAVLKKYYSKISLCLQEILYSYYQKDESTFLNSLRPLLGLGNTTLTQVICFHNKKEELEKVIIDRHDDLKFLKFSDAVKETSYFNIQFENLDFQMRIKPMNTFNNTSLKINCSLKYLT